MRFLLSAMIGFCFAAVVVQGAEEIEKVSLPVPKDLQRADLYVWTQVRNPVAVLVLGPGTNGNGGDYIKSPEWQKFAREQRLGLVGLSFASDTSLLEKNRGYYYASQGSGQVLLDGLRKAYGRDLPILLYGFSAGAHFTSRFVEWKPDRVLAWCAYSAGWWDVPKAAKIQPPGIVACGGDDPRLGASLIYFKQGRALGRPWLWVECAQVGHAFAPDLESFARAYFTGLLQARTKPSQELDGMWVDIDELRAAGKNTHPSVTAWLPNPALFDSWKKLNHP